MSQKRNRRKDEERADIIAGRNQVREALRSGRPVERILVADNVSPRAVADVLDRARAARIDVRRVERRQLDRMAAGIVHQGVVAVAAPLAYVPLDDLLHRVAATDGPPLLLILDEIQDPHNLGSLLRSADGAGADGVIIPRRRAAGLTMTVARTSAGAVEHVPVAQVPNLVRAMKRLKEAGFWIVGADMEGDKMLWEADMTGPLAVVVGGEGKGLGRLVRESCDFLVRIPMFGQVNSLNAGVAGALLLFETNRQRLETFSARPKG